MGNQQVLLLILGVIIIAIAIAVGLVMFTSSSITTNRDALIENMNNTAGKANQYKIRFRTMGGGVGSFNGGSIPSRLATNDDGAFSIITADPASREISGNFQATMRLKL